MHPRAPHRWAVALLGLTVTAVVGYGAAANARGVPPPPPPPDEESLVTSVWSSLGPEERASGLRQLDPARAEALSRFFDDLDRGGTVPVSSGGRVIGRVNVAAALERPRMPRSRADLVPICDESGQIVAYWGGPMGVIERAVADRPLLDLRAVAAKRGLNPDGSVMEQLLGQVPAPRVEVLPPVTDPPAREVPPPHSRTTKTR